MSKAHVYVKINKINLYLMNEYFCLLLMIKLKIIYI